MSHDSSPDRESPDGGDSGDGPTTRPSTERTTGTPIDRRRLLLATGLASLSGPLAGCGKVVESVFGGLPEETRTLDAKDVGLSKAAAASLGVPGTSSTTYTTRRNDEVDGTSYLLTETHRLRNYVVGSGVRYRLAVLSSPRTHLGGTATNPLASVGLDAFLAGDHGERFLAAAGAPTSVISGPSPTQRVRGTDVFRGAAAVSVYVLELPSGERGRPEPWYVALTRGLAGGESPSTVIYGCVVARSAARPGQDAESRARDIVHETAPNLVVRPTWSGAQVPTVSVSDLRLVQTVEDSTVSGGTDIDDPALVQDEPAAAMFGVRSATGQPTVPDYLGATVSMRDYRVQYDERSFDIRRGDVEAGFAGGDPAAIFHEARADGTWSFGTGRSDYDLSLPVFPVAGDTRTVAVDLETPVGVHLDRASIDSPDDFSAVGMAPLRVGFIEVQDPGAATTETDIDYGDGNGRAANYRTSVDSSFEYLKRVFPGKVVAYRHDTPMVGNIKEDYDNGTLTDAKEARTTLDRIRGRSDFPNGGAILTEGIGRQRAIDLIDPDAGGAFDVRVMILPRGSGSNTDYFDAHGMSKFSGYHWSDKAAVGALEAGTGGKNMGHASTTAQEIGHRFAKGIYHGARARTDDNGSADDWHASGNVESVGYDLTDGTYSLVTDFGMGGGTWSNGSPSTDRSGNPVRSAYTSYMSYTGGAHWADGLVHSELMAGRFQVSPSREGVGAGREGSAADAYRESATSVQPVIELLGWVDGDEIQFLTAATARAVPGDLEGETDDLETDPNARPVEITLRGPGGESLASATVADRTMGSQDHRHYPAVLASLPFPTLAVDLVATLDDATTELNPIVAPLRFAVAEIPAAGLADGAESRADLKGALEAVASAMDGGRYGDAVEALDEGFRAAIADGVVGYDAGANQPTPERLHALADEMVARLSAAAEAHDAPASSLALSMPDGSQRCVAPVTTEGTVTEFYGFDADGSRSANPPVDVLADDATVTFVHRNGTTGERSLVSIHGDQSGTSDGGGAAVMTVHGAAGAEWLVQDGPPGNDDYQTAEGPIDSPESAAWTWPDDRSDGGAIGPLGEEFALEVVHRATGTVDGNATDRYGVDRWLFVDGAAADSPIELANFADGDTGDITVGLTTDGCN